MYFNTSKELLGKTEIPIFYYSKNEFMNVFKKEFPLEFKVMPLSNILKNMDFLHGINYNFSELVFSNFINITNVSIFEKHCGIQTVGGLTFLGMMCKTRNSIPFYAILYLEKKSSSDMCFRFYIPSYGNTFDIYNHAPIQESYVEEYCKLTSVIQTGDENPEIDISLIYQDILSNLKVVTNKKENTVKEEILSLCETDYFYEDVLELMYKLVAENLFLLLPTLCFKLSYTGAFVGDSSKLLYDEFIEIYPIFEQLDCDSPMAEKIRVLEMIKEVLENY